MGEIEDFKKRVDEGDYDNLKNGREIYNSPNGIRVSINDQEGADLVTGKSAKLTNAYNNEEPDVLKPMSEGAQDFWSRQQDIADKAKADAVHQEALDSNAKANEGTNVLKPMSEGSQDYFNREQALSDNAKKDAAHQEALDSNAKANEGTNVLKPMSENAQDFWSRQQGIAEDAKKEAAHQQALDSNAKANEGTNVLKPMSEGAQDFFDREHDLTEEANINEESKTLAEERLENLTTEKSEDPVIEELRAENEKLQRLLEEDRTYINELKADITKLSEKLTTLMEQINSEHEDVTNPQPENLDQEPLITPPPIGATPEIIVNEPPQETTPTQEPVIIDGEFVGQPVTPPTQEATAQGSDARVAALEAQLRELRGENTPEQRSAALAAEIANLETKFQEEGALTDAEKTRYLELTLAKRETDKGLVQAGIESNKKRERKEKIIKWVAGIAGAGLALATPAVGVAAVVAVTLGGRFVGNLVKKASNNLISKSSSLKYESRQGKSMQELNDLDKKIKRNEWWGKRLGEASAVLIGGSTGYGIGSAFQNIFGWGASSTVNQSPSTLGQASVSHSPAVPEGSIDLPTGTGGAVETNDLISGDWFKTGDLGWDTNKFGWKGPNLYVPAENVVQGAVPDLQGDFLRNLLDQGVTRNMLMGQKAGEIFNSGLMDAAYRGADMNTAVTKTVEALRSLQP